MEDKKKQLGQFYTTEAEYILDDLVQKIPDSAKITDPFAGNWDLLELVDGNHTVKAYDLDPKNNRTEERDTLINPPSYEGEWVLTNPPYLHHNKGESEVFDKYEVNDLYKAALKSISDCEGGVIILPLNFFCDRDFEIRKYFLNRFSIEEVIVHEEPVFNDTTYTVCAFYFVSRKKVKEHYNNLIDFKFLPEGDEKSFKLIREFEYKIGSKWFGKINIGFENSFSLKRVRNPQDDKLYYFLRSIDTGLEDGRINLSIKKGGEFTPKKSDRTFAFFEWDDRADFDEEEMRDHAEKFNDILNENREKYHSMFLTTYRNSNRKRISFSEAKSLLCYIRGVTQNSWW